MAEPVFFATPADFREWLEIHHDRRDELIVGYWKKGTGKVSVTWEETVDEALCFGWIDGIRRRIDDEAYCIRFTPRRPGSVWSQRNLDRVEALRAEGRMREPGLSAWRARDQDAAGYTYQPATGDLSADERSAFGAHLAHFMDQPPSYRRQWIAWVHAAKREETRARRLAALVEASRQGIRLDPGRPFAHLDGQD